MTSSNSFHIIPVLDNAPSQQLYRIIRPTITQKIDEFDKNAIRQKILTAINDDPSLPNLKCTSLCTILKHLSFVYTKKTRNSALTERSELVCWRQRYLEKIKFYRSQGHPIYYLDETWGNDLLDKKIRLLKAND